MGNGVTRATLVWVAAAAVVGGVAGVLWVMQSDLGGGHTGTPLLVGAVLLTILAAGLLYHGLIVAAREQDHRADAVAQRRRQALSGGRSATREPPDRSAQSRAETVEPGRDEDPPDDEPMTSPEATKL